MDTQRFDHIARLFASRRTRRAAIGGGLGLAAAAITPLAAQVVAQDATPQPFPADPHPGADDPANVEFLFVQSFAGGSWAPKPGEDGTYALTLSGTAANTIYFSDRPERVVGLASNQEFLDGLGFTPENPPNAALVSRSDGGEDVLVIELLSPVWDDGVGTLTYDARVLADYAETGLAFLAQQQSDYGHQEIFGHGALFIDSCYAKTMHCYNSGTPVGTAEVPTHWLTSCKCCRISAQKDSYCNDAHPDQCGGHCTALPT